jgi:hypothetical protein
MTKAVKELIIVFLVGAGMLSLLWGFMYQKSVMVSAVQTTLVRQTMWSAVGAGAGLIVVGATLGLFLKPAKK